MIKLDRNMSELRQILYKNVVLILVCLLVLSDGLKQICFHRKQLILMHLNSSGLTDLHKFISFFPHSSVTSSRCGFEAQTGTIVHPSVDK